MKVFEKGKRITDLELMLEAAKFYEKKLHIVSKVPIKIIFTDQYMGNKFLGKCFSFKKCHLIYIRKTMDTSDKLKILAHELTHVKQHIHNEYVFVQNKFTKKFDVVTKGKVVGRMEDYEYKKRPWEIEAKRNEERLYKKFIQDKTNASEC
jgi:hypothetical protein